MKLFSLSIWTWSLMAQGFAPKTQHGRVSKIRPLFGGFDGADSLLNKIEGASLGSVTVAPPPVPSVVNDVLEKVSYDTTTSVEPVQVVKDVVERIGYDAATTVVPVQKVAGKMAEAAAPAVSTASSVSMPSIDIQAVQIPSLDMPSMDGLDLPLPVLGGIAIAVVVAVILGSSGGRSDESALTSTSAESSSVSSPSEESSSSGSVDISIPYDAAAMLAYEEAGKPGDFETFKKKYLADTVAMVKKKQKVNA